MRTNVFKERIKISEDVKYQYLSLLDFEITVAGDAAGVVLAFFDDELKALKPLKVGGISAYERHRDLGDLANRWIANGKEVYIAKRLKTGPKNNRLKHPIAYSDMHFLKAMKQAYGLPLEGRNGHYEPIQALGGGMHL